MEASTCGVSAPATVYEIVGQRFHIASNGFAEAIANAHTARQRPQCLCVPEGVEMYVARLAGPHGGYIVKRMPDTGCRHSADCPSYEPATKYSDLGQPLGSAISNDPATGQTRLRLGFPLIKISGRSQMPPASGESETAATDGTRLSLRGLLLYLWDQAELTRWYPWFEGKRSWATVRKFLMQAATQKIAQGCSLQSRLYIPEIFSVDQREALNTRRFSKWTNVIASPGKPQQLMLMIAEVKEIGPTSFGYKIVVKHVPEHAFSLDARLFRHLVKRFEPELKLWSSSASLRMVMIATFFVSERGFPTISELSLMPVTSHWLPVGNYFEHQIDSPH